MRGAEIAADVVLAALAGAIPIEQAHVHLARRRAAAFRNKWRFNRAMRSLVSSPRGLNGAALAAAVMPALFEGMVRYAGDCTAA